MSFTPENKKTQKNGSIRKDPSSQVSEKIEPQDLEESLDELIDENLSTIKKVHAILLNCINLTKKQKLEFAESERFFMKLHLKKLLDKLKDL
jgi:Cdc6-like AAA superfamily ATPase